MFVSICFSSHIFVVCEGLHFSKHWPCNGRSRQYAVLLYIELLIQPAGVCVCVCAALFLFGRRVGKHFQALAQTSLELATFGQTLPLGSCRGTKQLFFRWGPWAWMLIAAAARAEPFRGHGCDRTVAPTRDVFACRFPAKCSACAASLQPTPTHSIASVIHHGPGQVA